MEESFRRFTGRLSNEKVIIFATENNGTSEAIINHEFLQMKQNQSWHSEALSVRELWYHNRNIILTATWYENRRERERTNDMRVKIYLHSYNFNERKYSIYEIYEITES